MPAKHPEPLSRTNVLLPQSDLQRLRRYYPQQGALSQILRALLKRHLSRIDAAVAAKLQQEAGLGSPLGQPGQSALPLSALPAEEILSQEELNDQ